MLGKIMQILVTCGLLLYPVVMYVGLRWYSPRLIAIVLGLGAIGNLLYLYPSGANARLLVPVIGTLILCLISALSNQSIAILYLPLFISTSFGLSFGYSLWSPPSIVEVFARMRGTTLSEEAIRYCRLVTQIWVVFFALNAAVAGFTACCTKLETWSLYNGFISYCVIGLLFMTELCYRYWRFRRYVGAPTDVFFRRIFPPKE
jgi:uncharacterized membrane protein